MPEKDKVIVQFGDRSVKGYVAKEDWPPEKDLGPGLWTAPIRFDEEDEGKEISLVGAKSVFFVKTFAGKKHDDLRFHDDVAPMDCLWVRVVFRDGEVIEGMVRNNSYFVTPARLLHDPHRPRRQ